MEERFGTKEKNCNHDYKAEGYSSCQACKKETSLRICKECKNEFEKEHKREFCSENCRKKSEKKRTKKYRQSHKKYFADKVRKYAHSNPDKIREKAKKSYEKDKTKALVRAKTRYCNEKTGICSDCKEKKKTEFHHISYEPNLFIEVCKSCHLKRHGDILHVK